MGAVLLYIDVIYEGCIHFYYNYALIFTQCTLGTSNIKPWMGKLVRYTTFIITTLHIRNVACAL